MVTTGAADITLGFRAPALTASTRRNPPATRRRNEERGPDP